MGHGYKGDTGHHHSITENLQDLTSNYEYNRYEIQFRYDSKLDWEKIQKV